MFFAEQRPKFTPLIGLIRGGLKDALLDLLSCYDRVIIRGTLPGACYSIMLMGLLYAYPIKIFDYSRIFAYLLRIMIRENAQSLAKANGVEIEHVGNSDLRKEYLGAKILAQRGDPPDLVHII